MNPKKRVGTEHMIVCGVVASDLCMQSPLRRNHPVAIAKYELRSGTKTNSVSNRSFCILNLAFELSLVWQTQTIVGLQSGHSLRAIACAI